MIIDSRKLPDGAVIDADLCIVGAGAAGITLAREFLGRRTKVVVLESGGLEPDPDTQALYQGSVSGFPYEHPNTLRLRYFGGTTNHWAGNCRPLDEADFEDRSWLTLAPGTRISGDRKLSGAPPKRANRAGQALRLAAASARNNKSYIGATHRARLSRLDAARV